MNPSLESLVLAYQSADESRRAAALQALRGEQPSHVTSALGRTFSIIGTARTAGISRQTVYSALKAGVLKASPLFPGGRPRVRESDLIAWLAWRAEK